MPESRSGRSAAEQRKQYVEALEDEKRGYEQRGDKDRVKLVDEQIRLLTSEAKPKPAEQTTRADADADEQPSADADEQPSADADEQPSSDEQPKPSGRGRGRAQRG